MWKLIQNINKYLNYNNTVIDHKYLEWTYQNITTLFTFAND